MSKLEPAIDELYRHPLGEFVQARAALAKTLAGADAQRVKRLPKPTLVPWAVNQVYWHARPVFDRLMKSGERVRAVQLAALKGRTADVRAASEAHRKTISEAVQQATRLAEASGSHPSPDALMRTFEALSVATDPPEPPGRFTQPLQPAGFEALAGITPTHVPAAPASRVKDVPPPESERSKEGSLREMREVPRPPSERETQKARAAEARREKAAAARAAADARRRREAIKKAEAALERATAVEARARAAWERAQRDVAEAQAAIDKIAGLQDGRIAGRKDGK